MVNNKHKKYKRKLLFILDNDDKTFILSVKIIIFLGLFLMLFSLLIMFPKALGTTTINYTFNQNQGFQYTGQTMDNETFNTALHQEYDIGNYSATYSFDGEVGLTSTAISYVDTDSSGAGCSIEVGSIKNNHKTTLNFIDASGTNQVDIYNTFASEGYGTIEFWYSSTDVARSWNLALYNGATSVIRLLLDSDGCRLYRSGGYDAYGSLGLVNTRWFLFTIDFELTAGGYKGLGNDYWSLYINNIFVATQTCQSLILSSVDNARAFTGGADTGYTCYIDAIGYTWNSYTQYENNKPIINYGDYYQVDKWEFCFDNGAYTTAIDLIPPYANWDAEQVGVSPNLSPFLVGGMNDRVIKFGSLYHSANDYQKVYRDDFNFESGIIDITTYLEFTNINNANSWFSISVYSFDSTLISQVNITDTSSNVLSYWNGASYDTLLDGIQTNTEYNISLHINKNIQQLQLNNTLYNLTAPAPSKDGLTKISFEFFQQVNDAGSNHFNTLIDNIGVYYNGSTLSDDFGYISYNTTESYNPSQQNIFTIVSNGSYSLSITNGSTGVYDTYTVLPFAEYNGTIIKNTYSASSNYNFSNSYLIFTTNSSYIFSTINIFGVKLSDGTTTYYPSYSFGNVNTSENYFYVSNHKLYYSFDADSNNTEYMSIYFNINNISCENYSYVLSGYNNFDINGFTMYSYVYHTDATYTAFVCNDGSYSYNYLLNQNKNIDYYLFKITDNNLYYNYSATGYIYQMKLNYIADLTFTTTTLSLIDIIIPLIILITPSIILAIKFGKYGFVITFMLMSVICFFATLIPLWIFTVIMISSIGFLIFNKKREGD